MNGNSAASARKSIAAKSCSPEGGGTLGGKGRSGGSAALAVGLELMQAHGVDSLVGRTAAVMLGSTETTFYTSAVYFGAAGIKKTRYAVPAALCADIAGFLAAALTTRLLLA